jgi:radical SAM superfamily enzyme YgiQ (UPF0313 family)
VSVAVAFPHSSWVAMSNLGYHAVLRAFLEDPVFSVARVFWERGSPVFPDGGRSLLDFDVVAVSVSHQPDLVGVAGMLAPAADAGSRGPLVVGGGAALTINPEPAAPFFDLIVLGDGEPVFPLLLPLLAQSCTGPAAARRGRFRGLAQERLSGREGAYLPFLRGPRTVGRAVQSDLSRGLARPAAVTRDTEFGSLYPFEVSRGCAEGCRFCAAGAVCRPVRYLGPEGYGEEMLRGLRYRKTLGLVGTAVGSHPRLLEMGREALAAGGRISPSSLRADRITPQLAEVLKRSGHAGVALAPEAGAESLRRAAGKRFTDADLLSAAEILQDAGIARLKLYFMVGLPGEADRDAEAAADLALAVREVMVRKGRPRGRVGELTVNATPFVPKPHTAWQREPMAEEAVLARRMGIMKKRLARAGGVRLQLFSPRAALLDALLSLSGREAAPHLSHLPPAGVTARRMEKLWPGAAERVFARREGPLPWGGLG